MIEETSTFELHKKQYEALQYKLLFYSGLSIPDQIFSLNVPIFNDSWVHQVTCGNQHKHILLLHGYGGTSLTFIRLFKQLSTKYTVHALDLLGMGLSHRKDFNPQWEISEVTSYFIDAIQEWRKERKIAKMTIAGHSYGGYIASCYASKYVPRVERLCLISPAGTKTGSDQTYEQDFQALYNESSCIRKVILSIMKRVVKCKPTPSSAMNWCCIGPIVMDRALSGRLRLENQEKQDWLHYMKTLSRLTPNSELSFWKLFYMPSVSTPNSIHKMYSETAVPFRIEFYYGDSDWMEKQTALAMSKCPLKVNRINYTIIPNSGHQILFENPEQMISYLL